MELTVEIIVLPKQFQVMIGFYKNKICIYKIIKNRIPIQKVCYNDNYFALTMNLVSIGWVAGMMLDLKRFNAKIPYGEFSFFVGDDI